MARTSLQPDSACFSPKNQRGYMDPSLRSGFHKKWSRSTSSGLLNSLATSVPPFLRVERFFANLKQGSEDRSSHAIIP